MALQQPGDPLLSQDQPSALATSQQAAGPKKMPQFIGTLSADPGAATGTATTPNEPQTPTTRLRLVNGAEPLPGWGFSRKTGQPKEWRYDGETELQFGAPRPLSSDAAIPSASASPLPAAPDVVPSAAPAVIPTPAPIAAPAATQAAQAAVPSSVQQQARGTRFGLAGSFEDELRKRYGYGFGARPQATPFGAPSIAQGTVPWATPQVQRAEQQYSAPYVPVTKLGNIG